MGSNVGQMYLDLTVLLQDICQFLSTDTLSNLSPKDKQLAESLINRSKKQLQEIAKIQTSNDEYVEMTNNRDNPSVKPETPPPEDDTCNPYIDLPAKNASTDIKSGTIILKRKCFLGFPTTKQVFATIHQGWLLIYGSEKDMKPSHTFNLKNHHAVESEEDKNNKAFLLFRNQPGKNPNHFIARTPKDMLQWTVQINRRNQKTTNELFLKDNTCNEELNKSNNKLNKEHSEINSQQNNYNDNDDSADEIYEEVTTSTRSKPSLRASASSGIIDITNTFTKKPLLSPTRQPSKKLAIKVCPPVVQHTLSNNTSSNDSLVSYEEIKLPPRPRSNSTRSFDISDDSRDSTYEMFSSSHAIENAGVNNTQKPCFPKK